MTLADAVSRRRLIARGLSTHALGNPCKPRVGGPRKGLVYLFKALPIINKECEKDSDL